MDRIDQIFDIEETEKDKQDDKTDAVNGCLVFSRNGPVDDDFHQGGKNPPSIQRRDRQQVGYTHGDGQGDDHQQRVIGGGLRLSGGGRLPAGNIPRHGLLE